MKHFPLFFDLAQKPVLVCGGDSHALYKIQRLLPFGAAITVVSPHICKEIKALPGIVVRERAFAEDDLDSWPVLVITTEPEPVTVAIYAACQRRHIPVNAVDKPTYCDVIFPSVVSREHLCVGISSGGLSPTATVALREQIEELLPEGIDSILAWMGEVRPYVMASVPEIQRKKALRRLFDEAVGKDRPLQPEETESILQIYR